MSRQQSGQAIVLIALMLTVLIGMAAIGIDGGRAYAMRRDLQAAVDSAALAAADKLQQSGSYPSAEQAATANFGSNIRLYSAPSCSPSYGTPSASPWTVTCTYADGTVLTDVARDLGPQGSQFVITATRSLQLQFGRILTNGTSPNVAAASTGNVDNLLYTPALAALNQAGCGGAAGTAITINGGGTLNVNGDVVSNGTISVPSGALRVAGDIYARCQSTVPGSVSNGCYPSGAATPCSFPDAAGATRAGFRLANPGYPAPAIGAGQGFGSNSVIVPAGVYASIPALNGNKCWFLSGGVYSFPGGVINNGDFPSNELKPPDEPDASNNAVRAANQFWDTDGVQCAGAVDVAIVGGPRGIPVGNWAFELTSVRTDTYGGVNYTRESAPSMCYAQNVNNSGQNVQISVSNVPGATSYNIYASPPSAGGTCTGDFGLVTSLPVAGSVTNSNTTPCPLPVGSGCSLGNESIHLDSNLLGSFAPNGAAAAGTSTAYPPDRERAPLAVGLPNQNPARGALAAGDRANENNCKTVGAAYATCPAAITPGAVEFYFPPGGCLTTGNGADLHIFSGYQYNWVSVYEPASNACTNGFGAMSNSAYIGLVYCPAASINVISPYTFEAGSGGVIAASINFTGTLPTITFNASYAPAPPASRLTG